jgi:hypothetical protein
MIKTDEWINLPGEKGSDANIGFGISPDAGSEGKWLALSTGNPASMAEAAIH